MIHVLFLAAALAQNAQTALGVQVTTVTTMADGQKKYGGVFFVPHPYGPSGAMYFFARPTVCDSLGTSERPEKPEYGWELEVRPEPGGGASLMWSRLQGAAKTAAPRTGTTKLAANAPAFLNVVIDRMDQNMPRGAACDAVGYSLVAHYAPEYRAGNENRLVEAELWFVHKTPDGKETSQRQVVRMRDGGRGDFYFDDLNLTASGDGFSVKIAIEVFGTIETGKVQPDGDTHFRLQLTRRYLPRETALGQWPKVGKADIPTTVKAGEVVSFILPPLEDDHGLLLGHRFSVRLRIKPLSPGQN